MMGGEMSDLESKVRAGWRIDSRSTDCFRATSSREARECSLRTS